MASHSRIKDRLVNDAIRRFQILAEERQEADEPAPARVITISRQLGAGGRRVGEALAEKLGCPMYDKEILEILARRPSASYQGKMFEALDERAQNEIESIMYTFMGRVDKHTYLFLLPKTVLTLAQHDCIILGRGAHLFLPDSLRVRVEASLKTRIANMVHFEGMSEEEARKEITRSDRSRARFVRQVAAILPPKYCWDRTCRMYDLTINTDHFSMADAASMIILAAEKRFGPEAE
ncbi:MAG: hypothetical protein GTO55_07245 [Armatimonadetes bacterium]|nr:hypothetical protein [Armatimonadota bacterium]NIM24066.1 hypothetical protein [Armatimonadota bacterium]NIM67920.1 hypothetical protein [Armatimonadota bacterium]NIM76442.1 hypothetical protein [Armatimonadota bacterium]NIN06150.1 hypothetical protein [Armatimonadota bacterium]